MPGLKTAYLGLLAISALQKPEKPSIRPSGILPPVPSDLLNSVRFDGTNLIFGTNTGKTITVKGIAAADAKPAKIDLTSSAITGALNNGVAPDIAGSIKGLGDGWWKILENNDQITGRPPATSGDLVILKQKVGDDSGFILVTGSDKEGHPAMWMQSRVGGTWSGWVKFVSLGDEFKSLKEEVDQLTLNVQSEQGKLSSLEQAISTINGHITTLQSRPVLTEQEIEQTLISKGWGPLSKEPAVTDGSEKLEAWVTYSNTLPRATGIAGQVKSDGSEVTISRSDTKPERITVLVKNDKNQVDRILGLVIDGGLRAIWEHRDVTIGGVKYRAYFSPSAFYEQSNSVKIDYR